MDIDAVRTFVAVADAGQFQHAAADLNLTQQAVSKRIAALERDLGARLFTRTPRGALLTAEGRALLPHAHSLLRAAERAVAAVRPDRRPLRVDVIGKHLAPNGLLQAFHRAHPDTELDVVTLFDADAAIGAVAAATVDATFRAVTAPVLPEGLTAARVDDEPIELLTAANHPLATGATGATADTGGTGGTGGTTTPAALAGHRIWMPAVITGTEWAAYYLALAAAFGLTLDRSGPDFGVDPLVEAIAANPDLATFVGARTRLTTPPGRALRRIALRHPTPVYPHSLVFRTDNPHPTLAALRAHLGTPGPAPGSWVPDWAR